MEPVSLNLEKYAVTLQLPRGLDIDTVTLEAMRSELDTLDKQAIIDKLTSLGCANVVVLPV